MPTILFEATTDRSQHGNFHPEAWRAINADPGWSMRLRKVHSQSRALPEAKREGARELDSSNSSDALLMNCFCFPGAVSAILQGLALPPQSQQPVFGYRPQLKLNDGTNDETEIDMKIGSLIFEAKLTERDFTSQSKVHVSRYQDFSSCFDVDLLPSDEDLLLGYQLIRNVLAAAQLDAYLVVLLDQRRPDLLRAWWSVHSAISDPALRVRCGFRTWQEVVAASPRPSAEFLRDKYGL